MNPDEFSRREEEALVYQRNMMAQFKTTETFLFLKNLLEMKKYGFSKERQKVMRIASSRDMVLYFTGKEDAINEVFEAINQVIADGDEIRARNELIQSNKEY